MMKYIIIMIGILTLLSTGCGDNASNTVADDNPTTTKEELTTTQEITTAENSGNEQPTGYPSGEVQRLYVFYNDKLYVYNDNKLSLSEDEITQIYEGYEMVGTIQKISNQEMPDEQLEASRCEVGLNVYANQNKTDEILLYYNDNLYTLVCEE